MGTVQCLFVEQITFLEKIWFLIVTNIHEYIDTLPVGEENIQVAPNNQEIEIYNRRETTNCRGFPGTNPDESMIV